VETPAPVECVCGAMSRAEHYRRLASQTEKVAASISFKDDREKMFELANFYRQRAAEEQQKVDFIGEEKRT
jgi:hypothetical protein